MAAVPGMVPRNPNRPREGNSAADRQAYQDRLGNSRGPNPTPPKPYPRGQGTGAPNKGPKRPGQPTPKKVSARPDAFGTAGDFEKSRKEWAINHPDNKGKPKIPVYTPPNKLSPAGRSLKGTSAVHGMIPIG